MAPRHGFEPRFTAQGWISVARLCGSWLGRWRVVFGGVPDYLAVPYSLLTLSMDRPVRQIQIACQQRSEEQACRIGFTVAARCDLTS